jgi:integrase
VLSDLQIRKLSKVGKHRCGDGLHLEIHARKAGGVTKSWSVRYTVGAGKERWMGLGPYPEVSLARARTLAADVRSKARDGVDPLAERDRARQAERAQAAEQARRATTFEQAALAYIAAHEAQWRNDKHRAQWRSTLASYAFPIFGARPVADIDIDAITAMLDPIWSAKPETASRLRGRVENILDWATVRGLRQGENPARWRGHLQKVFPAKRKVRAVRHHAAAGVDNMAELWAALSTRSGAGAAALRFTILTAARSGEVRGARWREFDRKAGIWTIPAERMKALRPHRVPLSARALSELADRALVWDGDPNALVFESDLREKAPLSDMTLAAVLKRMGRPDLTVHGFRSTFRDWAADHTDFAREVIEAALAHAVGDATERAYRRGDALDKRQALMTAWAEFVAAKRTL